MTTKVFISASGSDVDIARDLSARLREAGLDPWLAADEIGFGDQVAEAITERLASANAVVLIVGSEPSDWVRREWSQALQSSWSDKRETRVVPLIVDAANAPPLLRDTAHVDWHGDPQKAADQVVALLGARDSSGQDSSVTRSGNHGGDDLAPQWSRIESLAARLLTTDERKAR
ncbi:MAG TPA: toll/interleukin-1 receptor domain-containing protein [Solirubrobacteraceae bacterium]|jgi:hypothetical protein